MKESTRPLMIVGCGGHGRVIADIAECSGVDVTCFLDDAPLAALGNLKVTGPVRDELTVIRNVPPYTLVAGCPAVAKKTFEAQKYQATVR